MKIAIWAIPGHKSVFVNPIDSDEITAEAVFYVRDRFTTIVTKAIMEEDFSLDLTSPLMATVEDKNVSLSALKRSDVNVTIEFNDAVGKKILEYVVDKDKSSNSWDGLQHVLTALAGKDVSVEMKSATEMVVSLIGGYNYTDDLLKSLPKRLGSDTCVMTFKTKRYGDVYVTVLSRVTKVNDLVSEKIEKKLRAGVTMYDNYMAEGVVFISGDKYTILYNIRRPLVIAPVKTTLLGAVRNSLPDIDVSDNEFTDKLHEHGLISSSKASDVFADMTYVFPVKDTPTTMVKIEIGRAHV